VGLQAVQVQTVVGFDRGERIGPNAFEASFGLKGIVHGESAVTFLNPKFKVF
jgi:hypothetical protein